MCLLRISPGGKNMHLLAIRAQAKKNIRWVIRCVYFHDLELWVSWRCSRKHSASTHKAQLIPLKSIKCYHTVSTRSLVKAANRSFVLRRCPAAPAAVSGILCTHDRLRSMHGRSKHRALRAVSLVLLYWWLSLESQKVRKDKNPGRSRHQEWVISL